VVADPRLAQLGLPLNTPLTFVAGRDSTVAAKLDVETAEDFVRSRCERDGLFHWCQLPFDSRIEIEAWSADRHASSTRVLSDRVTIVPLVLDQ